MISGPSQEIQARQSLSRLAESTDALKRKRSHDDSRTISRKLLEDFTPPVLDGLTLYARCRLVRIGLSADDGEDIVQDAICAVLSGGRRPRPTDLVDQSAFRLYLQGIIRSLVEGLSRRRYVEKRLLLPDGYDAEFDAAALRFGLPPPSPDAQVGVTLFAQDFFLRLKTESPKHLLPLIKAWADEFSWLGQIPLSGRPRSFRSRVRVLSQRIFYEMQQSNCTRHPTRMFDLINRSGGNPK